MSTPGTETILITVDIRANNERLVELTKQLNENKEAQKALADANKAGRLSADELAAGQVRLKQTAADVATEQRALLKANAQQQAATLAATGSNEQLRAQLALATTAYNKLSTEERNNTEAGQKLQAQTRALSDELKKNESAVGDNRRNVGNYAASIEPLIAGLVKLQEEEKRLTAATGDNTAALEVNKRGQIGFGQQLADTGAKMGLTADQTSAKLKQVGEAIRPATANLVKLEEEQAKVEKGTTAYTQIGFKIGQANKEIAKVPAELKQVEAATEGVKSGFSTALSKGLAPFQNELDRGTGLLGKFKSGNDLVKDGLGLLKGAGETGSLGFKAIAGGIALTGIGLFVIAISAVVAYFTQSAEGGKQLAAILAGLGAVVQVATDAVTGLGKSIVYAVTHPLEAIKNLSTALANAFLHPIDTARGLGNAIATVTTRTVEAGKAGAALALEQKKLIVARRELEIEDVKEQSRVNVLLRLSKERGKSATEQLDALKEAGRIEAELTEKNIKLQQREADAIREGIRLKGAGKAADLKAELGAKEKEIAQTLASQDETNAKIRVRESVFQQKLRADADAATKAAREARIVASQDAVRDRQARLETELLAVQKGSAAELVIKQRLLEAARDLELIGEKVTADQKKLIKAKSLVEIKALQEDFNAKQLENAKKHDAATAAEANREYAEALQNLENYLNQKRAALERDYAAGKISENQYQKDLNALEKAGLQAQKVVNNDYRKDNAKAEKAAADLEIKERGRVKAEKKKIKDTEQAIQEAGIQAAQAGAQLVIDLMGEETAAGQAALAIKKTLALAEIAINLQKQLSANAVYGATLGPLGPAYIIVTDALAIAGAAASAAKIAGFATGGIVTGPGGPKEDKVLARLSPGEGIINANSMAIPGVAAFASHLNQLGGGVAFPGYATGGVIGNAAIARTNDGGLLARTLGNQPGIDYNQLARVMSQHPTIVQVRDISTAQAKAARPVQVSTLGG